MNLKKILLALLLSLHIGTVLAKSPSWYQFEVIIFAYTNPQYTETETWPEKVPPLDINNPLAVVTDISETPSLTSPVIDHANFKLLKQEQLLLKKEANAIKRSSLRKLVAHTGWLQTMYSKEKSSPVAFKVGKQYTTLIPDPDFKPTKQNITQAESNNTETVIANESSTETQEADSDLLNDTQIDSNTIDQSQADNTIEKPIDIVPMIPKSVTQLDGSIEISVGRYLHVWTDLLFSRPANNNPAMINANSEYTELQTFRFQDHRRMRSKELHYIDNPSFGILIYALPYKTIIENK